MKTKILAVLLALLGFLTIGCQNLENSPPIPDYAIALEVVDQNGRNLLSNIEKVYAFCEALEPEGNVVIRSGAPISKKVIGNVPCLSFGVAYGTAENCPTVIVWKIRCKEIFSDEQIYDVKSYWEPYDLYGRKCTSFDFEGKTYVPELKNGYWTARVVLNR